MIAPVRASRALVLLLLAPLAAAQSTWDPDYPFANRIVETTFLYGSPDEEGRKLTIVNAGAEVRSTACEDGWCPVKLGDLRGYVEIAALARPEVLPESRPTANPDVHSAPPRPTPSPAAQDAPPAVELNQDAQAERFVGSKNSSVFHVATCSHVRRIAAHNLVTYESAAAAREQGKRPCKVCHPGD